MQYSKKNKGFSMIELLTAVAIIAILILAFIFLMRNQTARGNDARRKADLENIKVSFEDYFNDNDCYPPETILDVCGDKDFSPYLKEVPCDPMTGDPYSYEPVANCAGYRAYAILEDVSDPIIEKLGCDGASGCGSTTGYEYNYGISSGVTLIGDGYVAPASSPTPTPTPSPTPSPAGPIYLYACDSSGVCNRFEEGHPQLLNCPVTYQATNCDGACGNPANQCVGF